MSEDRDLNIFLLCKHNYIKIISRLDGIIENFENIKELNSYDCVSDPELLSYFINCQDDMNYFIKKRNEINEKLEFCRKNIKIKPEKGLTLIWPADWTHTHRGIASPTQEKFIITGWFNYVSTS